MKAVPNYKKLVLARFIAASITQPQRCPLHLMRRAPTPTCAVPQHPIPRSRQKTSPPVTRVSRNPVRMASYALVGLQPGTYQIEAVGWWCRYHANRDANGCVHSYLEL